MTMSEVCSSVYPPKYLDEGDYFIIVTSPDGDPSSQWVFSLKSTTLQEASDEARRLIADCEPHATAARLLRVETVKELEL